MATTTPLPAWRWLLDNCPCPLCLHPITRERTVTLVDHKDPEPVSITTGEHSTVTIDMIENLFSTDLAYLQEFYRKINEEGGAPKHHLTCPKCQHEMDVDMVTGALITEGGGSGQSGPG